MYDAEIRADHVLVDGDTTLAVRYCQDTAIARVLKAICDDGDRLLER